VSLTNLRRARDDAEIVLEPIYDSPRDSDTALECVVHGGLGTELIGHGGQESLRALHCFGARVVQQETARAVPVTMRVSTNQGLS
jgi:hypothetical protein